MFSLTAFQRDILYTLANFSSLSGTQIHNNLSEIYNEDITQSRVYSNLDQLVSDGVIKKGSFNERTNRYRLTDQGKKEIEARVRWEHQCLENADFIEVAGNLITY